MEPLSIVCVILAAIFVALNVGDIVVTDKLLRAGGIENNPLMRWAMDRMGALPAMVLLKAIMCLALGLILMDMPSHVTAAVLLVAAAFYYVILTKNMRELGKQRRINLLMSRG